MADQSPAVDPHSPEGQAARASARAAVTDALRAPAPARELVAMTSAVVDGRRIRVPVDAVKRAAFLAEHQAQQAAAAASRAIVDDDVTAFAGANDLERVKRWPNADERAALNRLQRSRSAI